MTPFCNANIFRRLLCFCTFVCQLKSIQLKQVIQLLFIVFFSFLMCSTGKAQTDSMYSIFIGGHAYGAHAGTNIGLHPPFLEKLKHDVDSTVKYIVLTGDIVNHSTIESWQQVENELSAIGVNSCYVMGNHGDNSIGHAVFQEKHGGTWYSFSFGSELYIVLNSTESDRSISSTQLDFLEKVLTNTDSNWNRAFIFFHEIIWNSLEKYKLVRSNSRSRYDQMKDHSNFWDKVFPMFTDLPGKEFYVIAGDVGGNPDAIAASYDRWENVTLISSGMGEVYDENYLKADISPDTVKFTLVPLNDNIEIHPIQWYNVPESPGQITGLAKISPPVENIKYDVTPVFNATSYVWNLSQGMTGLSDSSSIIIGFDENFKSGDLSVSAVNDGFGISEPINLVIESDNHSSIADVSNHYGINVFQDEYFLNFINESNYVRLVKLKIYSLSGSIIYTDEFESYSLSGTKRISKEWLPKKPVVLEMDYGIMKETKKIILY